MSLAEMKPGARGIVRALSGSSEDHPLVSRLMEMGMTVGALVEIVHEAPFGGTIAVRLRGSLVALRIADARAIEVDPA